MLKITKLNEKVKRLRYIPNVFAPIAVVLTLIVLVASPTARTFLNWITPVLLLGFLAILIIKTRIVTLTTDIAIKLSVLETQLFIYSVESNYLHSVVEIDDGEYLTKEDRGAMLQSLTFLADLVADFELRINKYSDSNGRVADVDDLVDFINNAIGPEIVVVDAVINKIEVNLPTVESGSSEICISTIKESIKRITEIRNKTIGMIKHEKPAVHIKNYEVLL